MTLKKPPPIAIKYWQGVGGITELSKYVVTIWSKSRNKQFEPYEERQSKNYEGR